MTDLKNIVYNMPKGHSSMKLHMKCLEGIGIIKMPI